LKRHRLAVPSDLRHRPQHGRNLVSIPSAGLRLHGALGVPADLRPGEKRSAFLVLHGFGTNSDSEGVRQPTRVLNEFGYVTLRFDMRGWLDTYFPARA
jgi:hypothetical protein